MVTRELATAARSDDDLLSANLRFYDPLWKRSRLTPPERFNT